MLMSITRASDGARAATETGHEHDLATCAGTKASANALHESVGGVPMLFLVWGSRR